MAEFNETGGVILDGPFDPDAQATVTDFIDYTEYLPADLLRSLTLIRGLDKRYLDSAQGVHDLTKKYGQLPDLLPEARPDPTALRKEISAQLDRAINARESAYAEACRLYDVVDRHFNRLDSIRQKLEALPKPVDREPTPPPQPPTNAKRPRTTKKEDAPPTTTRITLRLDGARGDKKSRTRRSLVAADLAGLHPDSPIASTEHSDNEIEIKPTPLEHVTQTKKEKQVRRSKPSGEVTNSLRASAGMSTSSALAMLKPPPEDAKPGSEDLPWLRLTEWEMTKLRKKMKKNAVWQPSEVMIHRELAIRGRGWEAYRAAKAEADANGTEFLDCDDIMNNYVPGLLTKPSNGNKEVDGIMEMKLSNRGMKLNEAKKLKRENQAREQAALAAAEAEAAKSLGQLGSTSQGFVSNGADRPQESSAADKPSRILLKKRKTETSSPPAPEPVAPPEDAETESRPTRGAAKRRKTGKESSPGEAQPGGAPTPEATEDAPEVAPETVPEIAPEKAAENLPESASDNASGRAPNTAPETALDTVPEPTLEPAPEIKVDLPASPKPTAAVPPLVTRSKAGAASATSAPSESRPPSRGVPTAEPVLNAARELRLKSATPARKTPVPEGSRAPSVSAPARRRKRPAPGPVSNGPDGGAAVSYGRRKAKPGKKRVGPREPGLNVGQDIRIDEDGVLEEIDPNEPRYCVCGDVSFGTMICCENPDCDREWFHLDCVGLSEVPSRTAKWYCPDCRIKFNKGAHGIIKPSSLRR
ncbi:hypothetical protein BDW74DRAFT_151579 [Aspergillus multicolor]|uniref:putative PHD finger domain protein n=1 Tax=Aspergillus multicolor TaxID=41759 RepID=UPI003CCD2173